MINCCLSQLFQVQVVLMLLPLRTIQADVVTEEYSPGIVLVKERIEADRDKLLCSC